MKFSSMVKFNFSSFLTHIRKNVPETSESIGVSANSFRKMMKRGSVKISVLGKLEQVYGKTTINKFIHKQRKGLNENH